MAEAHEAASDRGAFPASVLCRLLDITEQRFHQLVKEGVIPKVGRGQYPLAATVRAYIKFLRNTGAAKELDPDKLEPFRRKAHYESEMSKLHLQRLRGELVPRIEVEQEQGRIAKIVAEGLETLPDIMERDTGATPKQLAKVQDVIDRIRTQMHEQMVGEDDVRKRA